jgi:FkbM family methyltransferase
VKKRAFVLVNSDHGAMIVNRLDYNTSYDGKFYGVGAQILENGAYDPIEIDLLKDLLHARRRHFGKGMAVLDCGANIGVFTIEIANFMRDWGQIIAIEAQERLFYALAGNLALNNCFNARAIWAAIGNEDGFIDIPEPNYCAPGSFGSFELREALGNEHIGQTIDYSKPTSRVRMMRIDDVALTRVDLIKLDIEGMEMEALAGAMQTIEHHKPIIFTEMIKVDRKEFSLLLEGLGYRIFSHGVMNVAAVHMSDPTMKSIQTEAQHAA